MQNLHDYDLAKRYMSIILRRYRDKAGFSQQQLADKCGISKSYISALELGYRAPNLNLLIRIALALGTSPGMLVDAMLEEAKSHDGIPPTYLV